LAPTVGLAAALAGVHIRTGSIISSGERVVCGLAQQFGSLCFVDDNAGCFGGRPLPESGRIICFGAHQVFVATEFPRVYPAMVRVAEDPPSVRAVRGRSIAPSAGRAEVMMTAPVARSAAEEEVDAAAARKALRTAKLPLERTGACGVETGTSEAPAGPSRIEKAIEGLAKPIAAGAEVLL